MSSFDPDLRDSLERSSAGVRVTGDLAARAIARDRSNKRRELSGIAVAAGLVLAVAVPVALGALRPGPEANIPSAPTLPTVAPTVPRPSATTSPTTPATSPPATAPSRASASPTAVPTIRATGAPDAPRVELASGAVTSGTDIGYVSAGVYRRGDTAITLPPTLAQPGSVDRLGDGLVVSPVNTGRFLVVGPDGKAGRDLPSTGLPVYDADHTHVAFADLKERVVYADADGTVSTMPRSTGKGYRPVGIVGNTVYVGNQAATTTFAWDTETGRIRTLEGDISLVSSATGRGLRTLAPTDLGDGDTGCFELVDLATGTAKWRLCGPLVFSQFSPDGRYLVGGVAVDGFDPARTSRTDYETLVVLRTEDHEVVLMGGGDGTGPTTSGISSPRMGTDGTVTMAVREGGATSLQRCSLDATCAVVTVPRPDGQGDPEAAPAYVLAGG
ncbi:MAG: hypothetical protein ABI336_02985 [Humibacillus sp.]